MRIFVSIPPHTEVYWLRIAARILSSRYPKSVVIGPTTCGMARQLQKYAVAIVDPPPVCHFNTETFAGAVRAWLYGLFNRPWNQMGMCDMVMILWDGSPLTVGILHRATVMGKKVVTIRMTE